ncbi:MAG: transposase, partial [Bacteroidota bacterium]
MSRKYKFHNKEGLYFISFAVVYWIDVFVRD